jgi:hypothetical protein
VNSTQPDPSTRRLLPGVAIDVPGVSRVVSLGSVWDFDAAASGYRRMPLREAPRERPEWGDERAGPCEDFIWHALVDAWITDDGERLVIVPVDFAAFYAPMTEDAATRSFHLALEVASHGYTPVPDTPWRWQR